jgi:hypothetical protein
MFPSRRNMLTAINEIEVLVVDDGVHSIRDLMDPDEDEGSIDLSVVGRVVVQSTHGNPSVRAWLLRCFNPTQDAPTSKPRFSGFTQRFFVGWIRFQLEMRALLLK